MPEAPDGMEEKRRAPLQDRRAGRPKGSHAADQDAQSGAAGDERVAPTLPPGCLLMLNKKREKGVHRIDHSRDHDRQHSEHAMRKKAVPAQEVVELMAGARAGPPRPP